MTNKQLQNWAYNLAIEDRIELVQFYLRLCNVCAELDKK